ncbi:hypothetical protein JOM56_008463 [Amanita muscaria]
MPRWPSSTFCRCPVCDFRLEKIGNTQEQEDHIKKCLKGASKYLSYRLHAESTLIGIECKLRTVTSKNVLDSSQVSYVPKNSPRVQVWHA